MTKSTKPEDLAVLDAVKSIRSSSAFNACIHNSRHELSALNRANLRSVVKEISALRDAGTINDEEFSELIAYVCSVYIESEVEERFRRILGNKFQLLLFA